MGYKKDYVLSGAGHSFTEIPRKIWEQHVELAPNDISKMLRFMSPAHHLIRYFVVREMPRIGKPIAPERISRNLNMSLSKTTEILDVYYGNCQVQVEWDLLF